MSESIWLSIIDLRETTLYIVSVDDCFDNLEDLAGGVSSALRSPINGATVALSLC